MNYFLASKLAHQCNAGEKYCNICKPCPRYPTKKSDAVMRCLDVEADDWIKLASQYTKD